MDVQKILEQLKESNVDYVESLYYSPSSDTYHAVCKYPNGRVYVVCHALKQGKTGFGIMIGPYTAIEDGESAVEEQFPLFYKYWENPNQESAAGDLNLIYRTDFYLSHPVSDLEGAREYLEEDEMVNYARSDMRIPKSGRDKLEEITWLLTFEDHGYIRVRTNNYLTEKESKAISEWISGQCSDGLGEGFEQNFTWSDDDYYDEDDEYYEDTYEMCSFDWQTNDYELTLEE